MEGQEQTFVARCVEIRDLLGKAIALTHEVVGVPPADSNKDAKQPTASLDVLSSEIETIRSRASILFDQLECIRDRVGPGPVEKVL